MTPHDYDDKSQSVFFTVVGILGIPPALFGLFVSAALGWGVVDAMMRGQTVQIGRLAVSLAFSSVTLSGFWLLLQYIRRAAGKDASVTPTTLWRISTVQNTIYTLAALAVFIPSLGGHAGWEGLAWTSAGVLWFSLLTAVSASGIPSDKALESGAKP
jgi:hypothetical protein